MDVNMVGSATPQEEEIASRDDAIALPSENTNYQDASSKLDQIGASSKL